MKTNLSFLRSTTRIFFLATATLLLLSARSMTFAGSATWLAAPATGNWTTNANWTPNTGYPGIIGTTDVATFATSNTTSVHIATLNSPEVAEIIFNSGASAFTITVDGLAASLGIFGTGITNSSGITQNFVTAEKGGTISFNNSATVTNTAGSVTTFTNNGSTASGDIGGETDFLDASNAGSATITNNGGTVSGAFGGITQFQGTSNAGSATLIAKGGTASGAGGGSIQFFASSTGGTASVDVRNDGSGAAGNLDISARIGGVTIGSLEGSGNVFLGARNLTVGNNLSKTFSGVIQDGGVGLGTGGSLTKTGTGALTLTGANTYTGGTTVNAGSLFVNNTGGLSGTGTGAVTVSGGTLGGGNGTAIASTISGTVTVSSGANLAPGATGNGSTGILNIGALTLNSGANFSIDLNGPLAGTNYDQVEVTHPVFINGSNLVLNSVSGLSVGEQLFIVDNDGGQAVFGTFAGLAEGATFSSGGDTFTISYIANDGDAGDNDISLSVESVRPVPEPSTWVGGALAFAAVAYTQRRRFSQMLRRA